MTNDELKVRQDRLAYTKRVLAGHCAYMNFVLDLQKVTGLGSEEAEAELLKWLEKGIPFQETIDAYICGSPPDLDFDAPTLAA